MSRVCLPSRVFNDRRVRGSHLRVLAALAILGDGSLSHRSISIECGIAERDLRRELRDLSDYGYVEIAAEAGHPSSYAIQYNDLEGGGKSTPGEEKVHTDGFPPDGPPPFPPGPPNPPPLNPPSQPQGARASRLPEDWMPSEAGEAYAARHAIAGQTLARVVEDFRDYWHARAGPGALKVDWEKTWQTWVRREADKRARGNGRQPRASATDNLIEGFGRAAGLGPPDSEPDWSAAGPLLDGEHVSFDA